MLRLCELAASCQNLRRSHVTVSVLIGCRPSPLRAVRAVLREKVGDESLPPAVVSCHEAWDVDAGGQVPRCAQSGTANCAVALPSDCRGIFICRGADIRSAEVPLSLTPVLVNVRGRRFAEDKISLLLCYKDIQSSFCDMPRLRLC